MSSKSTAGFGLVFGDVGELIEDQEVVFVESLVGTAKGSRLPPGMPRCPTSKRPGAFNAHNSGDGRAV
jgi:hypothetical protein